jgi:hypothetical protein
MYVTLSDVTPCAPQRNVDVSEKMIFRMYSFVGANKMATISIKKKVYDENHLCSGFAFIVSYHQSTLYVSLPDVYNVCGISITCIIYTTR